MYIYIYVYIYVYISLCYYVYHVYYSQPPCGSSLYPCPSLSAILRALQHMAMLHVARRLCVNDCAVPTEDTELSFVDPYGLASEPDEALAVSLVDLKATANITWLQQAFKLPARWWVRNHHRVPLVLEIQKLIRDQKATKGGQARLPRNHKSLLPLQVRGKILWFMNDSRSVVLAVRNERLDDFHWFLQELVKDVQEHVLGQDDDQEPAGRRKGGGEIPEDLQDPVHETLQTLREHPQCLSAVWMPARLSFRVHRKSDKSMKELRVKDLKRKRSQAAETNNQTLVKNQFDMLVPEASEFLDSSDLAPDASSNQQPPQGPEVPEASSGSVLAAADAPDAPAAP